MSARPASSRRSRLLSMLLLGLIGLTALLAHSDSLPVGVSWNRTASLPIGLYWHEKADGVPKYGDLVCFPYKAPEWAVARHYFVEGTLLCKRVMGLPGDVLTRDGQLLEVCRRDGRCFGLGRIRTQDSNGRPVPDVPLPSVIPEGYAYLGIPEKKRSFDSRYLGLISIDDIKRTIHPLWVD